MFDIKDKMARIAIKKLAEEMGGQIELYPYHKEAAFYEYLGPKYKVRATRDDFRELKKATADGYFTIQERIALLEEYLDIELKEKVYIKKGQKLNKSK